MTTERIMPPWPASSSYGGPFRDARVITDNEIATLQAWAEAKCPEGNPETVPRLAYSLRRGRSVSPI